MWVCLNNSFLSIVAHREDSLNLLVRARVKGHIEAVFPEAKVYSRKGSDYEYRADIPRDRVAEVMSEKVWGIDYENFKGSVEDNHLHDAYMGFWSIMYRLQTDLLRPVAKSMKEFKLKK